MKERKKKHRRYTDQELIEIANQYKTKIEFQRKNAGAYHAATKRNILEDICKHMEKYAYTTEELKETASKYDSLTEFCKKESKIYSAIKRRHLLKEFCSHMKKVREHTKESLSEIAKRFNNRKEFRKCDKAAYTVACRRGIIDEICQHMIMEEVPKDTDRYTKNILTEIANKYETRYGFKQHSREAYETAQNMGVLDDICKHMRKKGNVRELSKEDVVEIAKNFNSRWDFGRGDHTAYRMAIKLGILDEVCTHMKPKKVERVHTDESLAEIAKLYRSRGEFQKKDGSAYHICQRRGILDKICSHMIPQAFSIPQIMCSQIFNKLFNSECIYNSRKIISPYELDIYYKELKFAIEYCGKGWHEMPDAIERDANKDIICRECEINLLRIKERSREYEEDIKTQIIEQLEFINKCTSKNILANDIKNLVVDYKNVYNQYSIEDIKEKINECSNIGEFQKRYSHMHCILQKTNQLHLLDKIRAYKVLSKEELRTECLKVKDYSDFVKNYSKLYQRCHKKGLLKEYTSHMKRSRVFKYTIEECIEIAKKYDRKIDFMRNSPGPYEVLRKNGIINSVFYTGRIKK